MRPEDFSPGNWGAVLPCQIRHGHGFNEAGGFLPRKRSALSEDFFGTARGFNEAGGFLPRKRLPIVSVQPQESMASMRPEDFSPGNMVCYGSNGAAIVGASMRPEDFSPGNVAWLVLPAELAD